jgi:hypothetical protein
MKTGEQIESLFNSSFGGPFPYEDCYRLADYLKRPSGDLIGDLDWYFGTVAGYSSSAATLGDRLPEELKNAERLLSKDFFQHFPAHEVYRNLIERERVPDLYRHMQVVEELRISLLQLLPGAPPLTQHK